MPTRPNSPTPPALPDWIPPGAGVNWSRVGDHGWHTLTLSLYLGNSVLSALGDATGAVIQEDVERRLTWLIEPKAEPIQHLYDHPEITISGHDGSFIFVPGLTRDHTVWWRVEPTAKRLLTPAAQLADTIATLRPETRPHPKTHPHPETHPRPQTQPRRETHP